MSVCVVTGEAFSGNWEGSCCGSLIFGGGRRLGAKILLNLGKVPWRGG